MVCNHCIGFFKDRGDKWAIAIRQYPRLRPEAVRGGEFEHSLGS